jgi:hypothetical protein
MVYRRLADIFKPVSGTGGGLIVPAVSWFEGIQVVTARDRADSLDGLFFSAKGGTNAESHNHNDVGNFLVYCDSTPVIVDAGVETYTKFTFNEKRYTLWTMQSCYHNTPTINGKDQLPGLEYAARDVKFESSGALTKFSLDIAGAYPADAGIESYRREFAFKHGEELTVTDTYKLTEAKAPLILNLLCYEKPELSEGKAVLSGKVLLEYGSGFTAAAEEIALTDEKIHNDWKKETLYRLRLTREVKDSSGSIKLRFTRK